MPELPEVQTVVNTLQPLLVGRQLTSIRLHRPGILQPAGANLAAALTGQCVDSLHRRGKRILLHLGSGQIFCIHLGMTGRLTVEPASTTPRLHTHLLIVLSPTTHSQLPQELRFTDPRRFGRLWLVPNGTKPDQGLGPEPIGLPYRHLAKLLTTTRRPIKSALLDQSLIAGLGNIYVDESLFAAGIHPLTPANQIPLPAVRLLSQSMQRILRLAIKHQGSTLRDYVDATGQPGRAQLLHQAYRRAGQPCTRCATPLLRLTLSGRGTSFCPNCQKQQP